MYSHYIVIDAMSLKLSVALTLHVNFTLIIPYRLWIFSVIQVNIILKIVIIWTTGLTIYNWRQFRTSYPGRIIRPTYYTVYNKVPMVKDWLNIGQTFTIKTTVWDRSAIWVTRKWYKTDHIFCMTSMQKTHNNNKTLTERFTPNAKIDLFLSHQDISDKTISRGVFYIIIIRPCKFYVNFVFISVLLLTKMWCFFKFRSTAAMKNLITCYAPKIE